MDIHQEVEKGALERIWPRPSESFPDDIEGGTEDLHRLKKGLL